MKKTISTTAYGIVITAFMSLLISCNKEDVSTDLTPVSPGYSTLQSQVNAIPPAALSDAELNNLKWMREEEKLARDVYLALYTKWRITVFNNIASSEQSHMDGLLLLLNKYGIPDPASPVTGVFNNPDLQALYYQLVENGNISIAKAYETGATIEDLDLLDLKNALLVNDNEDIRLVYESLMKGSRNHLRSFYKNLLNAGITYQAVYITQPELEAIINSAMETGF